MTEQVFFSLAIVTGAVVFFGVYLAAAWRTSDGDREPMPPFGWFSWVDRYLKATSFAIPLASLWWRSDWLLLWPSVPALRWAGLFVAAAGALVLAWALRTLGPQFSRCDAARLPTGVVASGPYRWVRHPVYTGNLLALAGLTLLSGSWLMVGNLLLLAGCYAWIAKREEDALGQNFDGYHNYAATRGRFFPRLW
ncbi:MAG: methyltransferase [Planctomycetota bacterium]